MDDEPNFNVPSSCWDLQYAQLDPDWLQRQVEQAQKEMELLKPWFDYNNFKGSTDVSSVNL